MTDKACAIIGFPLALILITFLILFVIGIILGKHKIYCECIKHCETCGKVVME